MRKFIISDIHGYGNVYYSIMNYLDNINKEEDIELYINGDLIDRGYESADILLDVIERVKNGPFKVIYLGGNHELMMYKNYKSRIFGFNFIFNDWYLNGGNITDWELEEKLKGSSKIHKIVEFIGNLSIYHKFEERIKDKKIVLVHAACPTKVKDICDLKVNSHIKIDNYVWTRKDDRSLFRANIGNKNYFTIVGHTPNNSIYGFEYHKDENYLNVDGGCALYVSGLFEYNHYPLVEVKEGYLNILTFNSNNEIIYGNYFDGENIYAYRDNELEEARKYLNSKVKTKKLLINEDGIVYYDEKK